MNSPEKNSFFEFIYLFSTLRLWKVWDYFRTFFYYYLFSPKFFIVDNWILISSFFVSPYRELRMYGENKKRSVGPYGETPFRVLDLCIRKFRISTESTWIDLGCGRSRMLFWLQMVQKQKKIIGVEIYPKWALATKKRSTYFGIKNISILNLSIMQFLQLYREKKSYENSVVYLYLSSMSEEESIEVGNLLAKMKGLSIISVSFAFQEYGIQNIELIDQGEFSFPWGKAELYYQKVT